MEKVTRFFCSECGKWIGVKNSSASMDGVFPYCPRCKKPVTITTQPVENKYFSAKCRQV